MAQILGYLSDDEAGAFQQYAADLRLDVTALANLLIVRELRRDRLAALRSRYDRDLSAEPKKKIVAHQSDHDTKAAFKAHANGHDLKPSRAAAIIFRAELAERWLAVSMDLSQFDSV
ncbi:MAG: hypothetical protein ACTHJU_09370 [Sphingopyxis sp.]